MSFTRKPRDLNVRYSEIDIMMDFYVNYSHMFDFKEISKKMEFILEDTHSWMDLMDSIILHGNTAFVALRYILMNELKLEGYLDDSYDFGDYNVKQLQGVLYPEPEVYRYILKTSYYKYVTYRCPAMYFSLSECIRQAELVSELPYLTSEGCKELTLIECIPVVREKKSDFYIEHVITPNLPNAVHVPTDEFDKKLIL